MNERELDELFAGARTETEADRGAAERFLSGHRQRVAQQRSQTRTVRAGWISALLASAAVVTGLLALRPDGALPSSAAYDAYQSALGEGW
ncbi:hypothetical protein [Deinococcus koreensis]|uniref:Uncharacterized protein n=1 Tax=Deinococcus koreensis TaxID=2054903 RepID=A0A2K3UXP8_9DEIO|nr:hypothetical protein [Deinococcus koreensis]PNY81309.1 hypothetical protein CVO96_07845 [Deinococcus koreensis]